MMKVEQVRSFALALPEATEEPHHHYSSFRVAGKIFATVPPDQHELNVFVDEEQREIALAMRPDAYEKLWWGKRVVGLRVKLAQADPAGVRDLLHSAWRRKAPQHLRKLHKDD